MKSRSLDPRKLDIERFAQDGAELSGEWSAASLSRLHDVAPAESPVSAWPAVQFQLRGEARPVRGGEPEVWLHLGLTARVSLQCQRCLQAMEHEVHLEREFQFVRDEKTASEMDADSEADVLVLSRQFDVHELAEDELLLALPLVPRHEQCPKPLPAPAVEEFEDERPNPFAALAALKGRGGGRA